MAKVKWLERSLITGPYLCLVRSQPEFDSAVKKLGLTKDFEWCKDRWNGATTHLFDSDNGELVAIVSLNSTVSDPITVSALMAHEAVHIWKGYCEHIGESKPSEELSAYAIQQLTATLSRQALPE